MEILIGVVCLLLLIVIFLIIYFRPRKNNQSNDWQTQIENLQNGFKEEFRINRQETLQLTKDNRTELNESLKNLRTEITETLRAITEQNQKALEIINKTLDEKVTSLVSKVEESNKSIRELLSNNLKDFVIEQRAKFEDLRNDQKDHTTKTVEQLEKITNKVEEKLTQINEQSKTDSSKIRETLDNVFKGFRETFDKNVESFNNLQREKFSQLEEKQTKLVESTEKKLDEMRATVDEKLQKTLNERLGQSFELVGKQLESVQKGLGEMQTLAQDVGGLKRVLSNVKMRGGFGEVQLSLLLEQILAPEQYATNVKTKASSSESVEFAIKLPGKDDGASVVWLPIDAKFPKDVYEQLQNAYETAEPEQIEIAQKNLEATIRKMAKSISEKYIDPPNTTDFAIMFLPFEGIYAEVVRKASLLEDLQRQYKIVVTGPTTLAAILNSLQMGFRTLVIQKRSSEVWKILGAVKKEFENFSGMLEKAQKNLNTASGQIDEVLGKRTKAIQRKLKGIETLDIEQTKTIIPEITSQEISDDDDYIEEK